jgi:cation diffusion facilitator family transporter
MAISLGMSVVMLAGKLTAYYISGSTAILSDAAESVIHGIATGFAFYSLWRSRQPADPRHPYGYEKMAYLSAGFEGAVIFVAGGYILYEAVYDLIRGPNVYNLGMGLAITAVLCLVNLALGLTLVRVGKKRRLLVLEANGKHVLTDMWTSLGVLVGVGIVWITGIVWLDPIVAMAAGLNIGWSAMGLIRKAMSGLLDAVEPQMAGALLHCLAEAQARGEIDDYHQLRMRQSGDRVWAEVHLLVPGGLSVREAHARVHRIEDAVHARLAPVPVQLTTHFEPTAHGEAHPEGHPGLNDPFAET